MIKSVLTRFVFVLALCATVSACEDTRRAVGFVKTPPDEFQVVQRAPLATPPDFALRPPAPGTVRPQEGTPREQAKAALVGPAKSHAIDTTGRDSSDLSLLRRAGVDSAQTNIRDLVDKESLAQNQPDRSLTDKIMFWKDPKKPGDGEQLNAEAEAARLQAQKALPKGTTDGKTPRIEKSSGGTFDWIRWPF